MRDKILLHQLQALPLDAKILMTQQRIREWYNYWHGDVYCSFSGGKDSTVLAHLVHDLYPKVPLVFANTGLEYPEIQAFARKMGAEFVRPKMSFSEVISKYGYPIISKETAEAIHAARRIVPKSIEKSIKKVGCMEDAHSSSGSNFTADDSTHVKWKWAIQKRDELGGGRKSTETVYESPSAPPNTRNYNKNQNKTFSENGQKNNPVTQIAHGERPIGTTGEEKLLPG